MLAAARLSSHVAWESYEAADSKIDKFELLIHLKDVERYADRQVSIVNILVAITSGCEGNSVVR